MPILLPNIKAFHDVISLILTLEQGNRVAFKVYC